MKKIYRFMTNNNSHPVAFIFAVVLFSLLVASLTVYSMSSVGIVGYMTAFFIFMACLAPMSGFCIVLVGIFASINHRAAVKNEISCNTGLCTAIIIPCYMEDMKDVVKRVSIMRESLGHEAKKLECVDKFDFFILSDTQDSEAAIIEHNVFSSFEWDKALPFSVTYRRRTDNTRRKTGNIDEWMDNKSAYYDLMVILDADSLMSGSWLIGARKHFVLHKEICLVQAMIYVEQGTNAWSAMAAFGSKLCGKLYSRGIAAWSGDNAPYWGHNAMIRVDAYRTYCKLPIFADGSTYLSHDVVEAALLSSAGGKVILDTEETNSFEGTPPDESSSDARDIRWCQGNLQHISLIFKRNLTLTSRVHISLGILHYLSAPFFMTAFVLMGFCRLLNKNMVVHPMMIVAPMVLLAVFPLLTGLIIEANKKGADIQLIKNFSVVAAMSVFALPHSIINGTILFCKAVTGKKKWATSSRTGADVNSMYSLSGFVPYALSVSIMMLWAGIPPLGALVIGFTQFAYCLTARAMCSISSNDLIVPAFTSSEKLEAYQT